MKLITASVVGTLVLLGSGSILASGPRKTAAPGTASYSAQRYAARWTAERLVVANRQGQTLVDWPIGSTCTPADPDLPVFPAAATALLHPVRTTVDGIPQVTWRWLRPAPDPIAEQVETCWFYPNRVELQVRVRWRGKPARLVRMAYGERLAPGCCDLEGLWKSAPAESSAAWDDAPVPGLFKLLGITPMEKFASPPARSRNLELVIGGIDDGDTTLWNGAEIGRTPSDRATRSWEKVRRYPVPSSRDGTPGKILVQVRNIEGSGGIWRGPCVLGPENALAATPGKDGWTRAAADGRALYDWCPDSYKQRLQGRFTVSLTSRDRTRDPVPENSTPGGRFMIPPYVVAIDGTHGWWGLGTLDLPRSEDGLRVEWRDGTLACPFLLATDPGAGSWTAGPRLAILLGQSKDGVLQAYRHALPAAPDSFRPAWWGGPTYCTWGDQVYGGRRDKSGKGGELTDVHLKEWLADLHDLKIDVSIVTLDAGWWNLSKSMVAAIHASGRHALLWTQPHWGPVSSAEIRAHPEWTVKDSSGRPVLYDPKNWLLDYSVPGARQYIARSLRSYVSPGEWDADGIKLDFPYTSAPVWDPVAHPEWGAGEQYRARVMRWFYHTVKADKPGALVTDVNANPLFGRVEDYCRLNDDWTGDPQTGRRRAALALAFGNWVDCDDWIAYEKYLPVQAAERPVWGNDTLMSALYRGDSKNSPVPLSAAWAARMSAIFSLARRAPVQAGERCLYDPDRGIALRETARGVLEAGAFPLVGKKLPLQVFVVNGGDRLFLTSIANGTVFIPTSGPVSRVEAVKQNGTHDPAPFRSGAAGITLAVQDAAGPVSYYIIEEGRTLAATGLKYRGDLQQQESPTALQAGGVNDE